MSTNIVKTIQTRLDSMGMSQAQFAECVSATPSQMSIFLRGKGALSIECLNKSLDLMGIDLSLYSKRSSLAKEIASLLKSKNVSSIENWTKQDLTVFTQNKAISLLFDVQSKEEYVELEKSGIIDVESTFPFFKALVSYYMTLEGEKPTASSARQALASLFSESDTKSPDSISSIGKIATGATIGAFSIVSPILGSVLSAATLAIGKQVGAFTLFAKTNKDSLFAKAIELIKK